MGKVPSSRGAISIGVVVALAALGLGIAPARATSPAPVRGTTGFVRQSGKLSPRLSALSSTKSFPSARAEAASLSLPLSGPGSLVRRPDGSVLVEIRTSSTSAAAVAEFRALGSHVVNVSPKYATVTAWVPRSALAAIAADPTVASVNEVLAPITAGAGANGSAGAPRPALSGCSPTISEGDTLMHVAAARAAHGVDGAGQTIGLLSDSFDTAPSAPTRAAADIATGDLPGPGNPCGYTTPVTVQSDFSGGGQADEGRAMAELAHGLAPAAKLAFATASNGELDFASQITNLRTVNHATVIVDDVSYFDEPFFQDGPIAVAANAASAAGVSYFSAAGNSNLIVGGNNVTSYETPAFRTTACPPSVTAIEPLIGCHNFDPNGGVSNADAITLVPGGGFGLDLQWAQPWGAVSNDYDVFLLNSAGTVVAGSGSNQATSKKPFEFFGYTNSTSSDQTLRIVIGKFAGGDSRMKFVMMGASGVTSLQYNTSSGGDIVGPTIFGHNGAATVGSTAAIPYNDSTTAEPYSSRGPATLYYQPTPSTTPLGSPQVLDKPDFAATDNVQNVFFFYPGGGVFRFPGTSAAAPQAAAIGALLQEYDPALSPAQVMSTLRSSAQAVPINGTAADVGGGYLDANAAIASVAAPLPGAPQVVGQTNGNARVTLQWTAANSNPSFPVIGYQVTPSLNGVPQPPRNFNSPGTSRVVTGLTNGGFYTFTIEAVDANGAGPPSAPSPQIVIGRPGKPGPVSAIPGNGRAIVKWTAPALTYGLPVVAYEVGIFVNSALVSDQSFHSSSMTQTVSGLKNGHKYTFEVLASNGSSSGDFSSASVPVTIGVPLAPTGVTAVASHTTAKVHWKAPSNNGSPITSYSITAYIGTVAKATQVFKSPATTETVVSLKPGQHYTFRVAATNSRGTGSQSVHSNVVLARH